MICDLCDEKATVFLTQIVDGQMQKVNMCEQCAKAKGVTDPTGFALADLLSGLGTEETIGENPTAKKEVSDKDETRPPALGGDLTTCQTCGFTHTQFKKAGRFGCPKCYEVFGDGLESLLKAMHKGTRHIGKAPERHQAMLYHQHKLDDLKSHLDQAITQEAFEEAARLRDEILKLETELESLETKVPEASSPPPVRANR
jgi:protein arginine kinase activator